MRNLGRYLVERFQPLAVVPLALLTAMLLVGAASPLQYSYFVVHHASTALSLPSVLNTLLVALLVLAFLLRTRVTDEFKDYKHDTANYPNRPLQRGLVTRDQLFKLGVGAFAVELGCAAACGIFNDTLTSAGWYLAVLAFSYLTAKEFFAPRWLARHFTIYFVSHQILFVCFAIWAYNTFGGATAERRDYSQTALVAFVLLMAAVEIVRKYELRYSPDGTLVQDTYPAVWGKKWAALVLATLVVVASGFESYALFSPAPFLLGATAATLIGASKPQTARALGFITFAVLTVVLWWS